MPGMRGLSLRGGGTSMNDAHVMPKPDNPSPKDRRIVVPPVTRRVIPVPIGTPSPKPKKYRDAEKDPRR